ncbi:MAG: ORF6N domain-containing protein [Prevotellaceae bacterium]|jgi:hypothetical protein|nr:ORF6N domain-containing protein [Prevotellaceae bacterium]
MELSNIQSRIYELKGYKVMLDFDLAEMCQVETKNLKRAIRQNIERFEDEDFMFEFADAECSRCQFVTMNKKYKMLAFRIYRTLSCYAE